MRPSTASTRASYAPFSHSQPQPHMQQHQAPPPQQLQQPPSQQSHPPPSAAQLARLADKKKEFEAVDALQRASALFLRRLEGLADDCEAMAEAGVGARPSPFSTINHVSFLLICSNDRRLPTGLTLLMVCFFFAGGASAWSGTRAVAADVPHPRYVWCVFFKIFFAFSSAPPFYRNIP